MARARFRSREIVDAEQWVDENPPFHVRYEPRGRDQDGSYYGGYYEVNGHMIVRGDWIVRSERVADRVLSDKEFRKQYEPVTEEQHSG